MLVLALDCATAATAVAVVRFDDDPAAATGPAAATLSGQRHVDPRAHGERLAPMITSVLAEAGARPDDVAAIVAGTGPGPYTGLRVGLVTAAAMAQALAVPAYGVCSLDGIGGALSADEPVLVATDARRREIYWALYAGGEQLTDPAVNRPADVAPVLAARGVRRGYGEGAARYADELGVPAAGDFSYPEPSVLARLAYPRIATGEPGEPLSPRYLRRPDARLPGTPRPAGSAGPGATGGAAMTVEPMTLADLPEILRIEEDLFGAERWTEGMFRTELEAGHFYLVARDTAGAMAGYAGLAVTVPDEGWVNNIAVRRDAQRGGIGRALLEALLAEAARRRVRRVLLEVAADNAAAQKLYAGYGFEVVALRRGYYQPSNTDALVMVREQ